MNPCQTKGEFNGDIWLGFERLTCVPIQTKMVKDAMLSREERQWLKVCRCYMDAGAYILTLDVQNHNRRCLDVLESYIRDDKRALKWLRREAERGIGLAKTGPGGIGIDWD